MKKTVETFAPLFGGFYESVWDNEINDLVDYEVERLEIETIGDYFIDYIDYAKGIVKAIDQALSSSSLDLGIDMEFQSLYQPREYNFETDSINVKLTLDFDKFISMVAKYKEKIIPILRERYSSRDGFVSYQSSDFYEWFYDLSNNFENEEYKVGAMLEILCNIEEVTTDDVYEAFTTNDHVGNYIDFRDDNDE